MLLLLFIIVWSIRNLMKAFTVFISFKRNLSKLKVHVLIKRMSHTTCTIRLTIELTRKSYRWSHLNSSKMLARFSLKNHVIPLSKYISIFLASKKDQNILRDKGPQGYIANGSCGFWNYVGSTPTWPT